MLPAPRLPGPGSPLPPARRPEGGSQMPEAPPRAGRRRAGRELDSPRAPSAGYLRRLYRLRSDKGESCARAARHPRACERGPRASEHPRQTRAGADSASEQGHPEQRGRRSPALLSRGGERGAAGALSLRAGCVRCHRRRSRL